MINSIEKLQGVFITLFFEKVGYLRRRLFTDLSISNSLRILYSVLRNVPFSVSFLSKCESVTFYELVITHSVFDWTCKNEAGIFFLCSIKSTVVALKKTIVG